MSDLQALLSEVPDGLEILLDGPDAIRQSMLFWQKGSLEPPKPQIELSFRRADRPEEGVYTFKSSSWSLAFDLVAEGTLEKLARIDGPARAVLRLEEASYKARNGERRGETVTLLRPVLSITGPA
ncbi:hypothetical protein ACIPY3_04485 [Paenarthrobacter sp. NPDC089714]|uniref:hypothetical protein n=1 Tax=Paenarthrobacter sp. NPDC089714 TaxID=3364377 RepID=UPI00382F6FE8